MFFFYSSATSRLNAHVKTVSEAQCPPLTKIRIHAVDLEISQVGSRQLNSRLPYGSKRKKNFLANR